MARVTLAAEAALVDGVERYARDHRDAVVALLTVDRDVLVAELPEALRRKSIVWALRLLQAQHVGLRGSQEPGDAIDAQADGIDVPGGDGQRHGWRRLTA